MNFKIKIISFIFIFSVLCGFSFAQNYINDGGRGKSIAFEQSTIIENGKKIQNTSLIYSTILKENLEQVFVTNSAITVLAVDQIDKILDIQRKSQDSRHSDSSVIQAGNLISQMYTAQSTIEFSSDKSAKNFYVSINIRNNENSKIEASTKVGPYVNQEDFYNYAANDIALIILPKLGVELSSLAKTNLSYRKNKVDESLVDAKNHYSAITASIENINKELSELTKSRMDQSTAVAQKTKLEAAKKQLEIQQKEANARVKRLEEDEKRREQDKKNSISRTAELNKKIEVNGIKFDKLANQKREELSQLISVNSKIEIIEKKKQTLLDLRNETAELINRFNEKEDLDCQEQINLIDAEEYSSIEKDAKGNPTKAAKNQRKQRKNEILEKSKQRKENYKTEQIASKQDADDAIRLEILSDIEELSKGQKENSLTNSNLLRFGNYDGGKKAWIANLNLIVLGKEISSEQILIPYNKITGFEPNDKTSEEKQKYALTVDEYNSYFAYNIPIVYAEINYTIQPHPNGYPSQYQIKINSYTFKDLETDKIIYEKSAKAKKQKLILTLTIDVKLNSGLSQYEFDNFMSDTANFLSNGYINFGADFYISDLSAFALTLDYMFDLKYLELGPTVDFLLGAEQLDLRFGIRASRDFSIFDNKFYGAANLGIDLFTVNPKVSVYGGAELGYYLDFINLNNTTIHTRLDFSSQTTRFGLGTKISF